MNARAIHCYTNGNDFGTGDVRVKGVQEDLKQKSFRRSYDTVALHREITPRHVTSHGIARVPVPTKH